MLVHVPPVGHPFLGTNPHWDLWLRFGLPPLIVGGVPNMASSRSICSDGFGHSVLLMSYIFISCVFFLFPSSTSPPFPFSSLPSQERSTASSPTPSTPPARTLQPPPPLPMATLLVSTYNVRGLSSPHKRSKLWWELKRLKTQVVFLQETHFTSQSLPKLPTQIFNQ